MTRKSRAPWRLLGAAALTCGALLAPSLAGTAAVAAPAAAGAAASTTGLPSADLNGYRNVGYFAQWGVYGLNYKLKDLQDSGAASKLTALNYAFGNISNESLSCFMANTAQGSGPNGSDGGATPTPTTA